MWLNQILCSNFFTDIWDSIHKTLILNNRWQLYFEGLGNTILIALFAAFLGVFIGMLIAVIKNYHENTGRFKILDKICNLYITIIRGTPVLVQLLIMFFVILSALDVAVIIAIITFGINSGAYVSEIARAGLNSVDRGQMEAGRSMGLSYNKTMFKIIIPQAIKHTIPPMGNEFISLVKETSIVGYIGILDITKAGSQIQGVTFEAFMPLIISAIAYLALVMILTKCLRFIERRLAKSDNR